MNAVPKVSIVIATFNAMVHLPECLASIQRLGRTDLEIVIVDGGSTDGTVEYVRSLEWPHLRWVSEKDKGIYDALNKGARMAKGTWVHFLGSDDRLLEGFSRLADQLSDPDTIYYANSEEWYYGDKKPDYILLGGKFSNYRIAKYPVNHQAIVYPTKIFATHSYNLKYRIFADYALNIQLWGNRRYKKRYVPLFIASYNMNGFSSTMRDMEFRADKPAMVRQHLGWLVFWRLELKRWKKKREGDLDW
ncbi:glycosyltransferase family 2 protein [Chitinophaga rhizosphaerae]|uniref:glycosyltransferase family 2 protein n=1 Tax=Chitinophaga rhizosphaerae TaxID=1864947 RepID=UPI000F80CBDE|nr:glycosyltransferase family 2 protein [Chitinophaga rhizosphaerae]